MNVYKNAAVQTVTCCNSFEFDELVDGHVAVFIDYQDEIKTQYQLISLFVQNAYKFLIEQANKTPSGRLDVPFYFMLDEFGNFPAITDFDTGITAARGRNIYFCLVLQSYSQLEHVYGKETAEIIGTVLRHGIPGLQICIVDTLLALTSIGKNIFRDFRKILSVFQFGFG
jgi:type IV secretion system protein VirD4